MRKIKKQNNEKGAAMLLALLTVIVLAAVATAFISIAMVESKTTTTRIDSELALQAANGGIEYLAQFASMEPNAWGYGLPTAGGYNGGTRRVSYFKLNESGSSYFRAIDGENYLLIRKPDGSGQIEDNELLIHTETADHKIVGCNVIIHPAGEKCPDIIATSIGYVMEKRGDEVSLENASFYATRKIQVILKEVSFYNYTYIYSNFTDIDLAMNLPEQYRHLKENAVGITPDMTIYGGIRAEGCPNDDPNDPNSIRRARILTWNADGSPLTSVSTDKPSILGPVRFVSKTDYNSTGNSDLTSYYDHHAKPSAGWFNLNGGGSDGRDTFQGSSTVFGSKRRGVPGANVDYVTSIMQAASGVSNPFGGRGTEIKHNTAGGSGSSPGSPAKGLAINNTQVCQDQCTDINIREDIDGVKDTADFSKNICKMTFETEESGGKKMTKVTVDIRNRYKGSTEASTLRYNNVDAIFGTATDPKVIADYPPDGNPGDPYDCQIEKQTYYLDQDAVVYVRGGNVIVEGEVASGVTVLCDDSRTTPDKSFSEDTDVNGKGTIHEVGALNDQDDIPQDQKKFFATLEDPNNPEGIPTTEGNVYIGGNLKTAENTTSAIGLVAENYMYLHKLESSSTDYNDYKTLEIKGVQLNSMRQSTQFDFFNYLGEGNYYDENDPDPVNRRKTTYFTTGAGSETFNGTFDFLGQMVGTNPDVEGDTDGRGYAAKMEIKYDERFKYYTAPQFYTEDYSVLTPNLLLFAISAFFDSGSLGSNK